MTRSLCGEGEPKGVRYKAIMLLVDVIPDGSPSSTRQKSAPPTAGLDEEGIGVQPLSQQDYKQGLIEVCISKGTISYECIRITSPFTLRPEKSTPDTLRLCSG